MQSIESGNVEELSKAIKSGMNILNKNPEGKTPIALACANGNYEVVKCLLTLLTETNTKKALDNKNMALHIAASKGYYQIVDLLLEHGADVNAKNASGRTALHLATLYCGLSSNIETCVTLLDHNANPNAQDNRDWSPLHYAAPKEHGGELVSRLLRYKANPLLQDSKR
ncbi:MAG UNVERIFIED_CONTAM: ankyrin repeat domain-containing protein [Rickettsiaceae bacterium]